MNAHPPVTGAPACANRVSDALAALDQAERALIDLVSPSTSLQGEARERLALLLDFFRTERARLLCEGGITH